jgi:hypothetical protein
MRDGEGTESVSEAEEARKLERVLARTQGIPEAENSAGFTLTGTPCTELGDEDLERLQDEEDEADQ